MIKRSLRKLAKLSNLLRRYPVEQLVHPHAFKELASSRTSSGSLRVLAFQSVPDKFYFLLFGVIAAHLSSKVQLRAEVVVVRAVSGAVGTNWLAELKRSVPFVRLWTQSWVRAYGRLIAGVAYRSASWTSPLSDLADWHRSLALWQQLRASDETPSLVIDGVEFADLIVDSYLRFKPALAYDPSDPFVRRLVWQVLRDVRRARNYFEKHRPGLYLTSYTTYIEHGVATRVALQLGVPVWSFGSLARFAKKLSMSDPYQGPDCSSYLMDFAALDRQAERLDEARLQLETRLSGGIDAATGYMRRSVYAEKNGCLPNNLAGATVVFLHDFFDSPHIYPELIFCDFWRWVCFTIETLDVAGVPFFLKPHPNQIGLSDIALDRLRAAYPAARWLPADVSNVQLAKAGISCGVTVFGTIAHELAYLGIPSIGCARHPHHAFDFCRTALTREEYSGMLKTCTQMPVPTEEMQRQALIFYYMHNLNLPADQLELKEAFAELWKKCNVDNAGVEDVARALKYLVSRSAFDKFVLELAGG